MVTCNPSWTPVDTESKLGPEGAHIQDPTLYRNLAGGVPGTLDLGIHLYASSTTSLVGYTDANWAGCPYTRRSTSAEYRGVANVVAKTAWLRNLLRKLHSPLSTATLVYCDNISAIYLSPSYDLLNKGPFFTRSWASRNKMACSLILRPASLTYQPRIMSAIAMTTW
ncbi:ribonuclease H-like domain-containing protein [Tanacetum coccineum]